MADLLIATKAFCNTLKTGSFSGDLTMCPTKSEIIAAGLHIKSGYIYDNDQLVPQDHIERLDWEYTFTVDPTTVTFSSAGGEKTISVTSYKKQYSYSNAGNHIYVEGSQTNVGYSSKNVGSGTWNTTTNAIKYNANEGSDSLSGTVTFTQNESGKIATVSHSQGSDSITSYDDPTVSLAYNSIIPASGATAAKPTYSYNQVVHWVSGKTTNITSGGLLTFTKASNSGTGTTDSSTGSTTAPSKGTTASSKTTVATVTLSVTLNGKTGVSSSANVYQAANSSSDNWNTWVVTCIPDPTTISASGGTSTLSGTAHRDGTRTWSSGSTQTLDSGNQSVTSFSIVSPVSGFSISDNIVTATSNSSTSTRSVQVKGTYSGYSSSNATITQSAATEDKYYEYSISLSPTSAPFGATGGSKDFVVISKRRLVTENSETGTSHGNWVDTDWEIYPTSLGTGFSQTTSENTITVKAGANSSTSSRSGTLSVRCTEKTSTTASASLSQSGATITERTVYEFSVSPTSLEFTKNGGDKTVDIISRSRIEFKNDVNGSISWGNWSAVNYTASSTNSAFSSTTPTGIVAMSATVSAKVNTGAARNATITYTQTTSGKIAKLEVDQAVGTQTRTVRRYVFSNGGSSSLSFSSDGGTQTITINSYYETATQTSTDGGSTWTPANPTSWGGKTGVTPGKSGPDSPFSAGTISSSSTGVYTCSISVGSNSSTSSRSSSISFSQSRSGIGPDGSSISNPSNINVPLNQHYKKTETKYLYKFSVSTALLEFSKDGGTSRIQVTSKVTNITRTSKDSGNTWSGWVSGTEKNASFSSSITGTGFSIDDSGTFYIDIKATSNSSFSERTGSLTLTQNRSNIPIDSTSDNKTITISLKQNFDSGTMIFVFDSVLNPYVDDVEIVITGSNIISAKFSKVYAGMTESYIVPVGTFTLTARKIPSMESVTLNQYSGNLRLDERVTIHVNVTF